MTGKIVLSGKQLGIIYHCRPDRMQDGMRLTLEDGLIKTIYAELPEVTEFTPSIMKRIEAFLPKAVWAGVGKDMGMTGTDPEIFGFNKAGDVIPAWQWLSTKADNPEYYWDGVQGEFVTVPTVCHNYQCDAVHKKLKMVHQALKAHDKNAYLATKDVVKLPRKTLLTSSDEHIILGCSPSQNAYEEVKPIDIGDPREHPLRYSGCHMHTSIMSMPIPKWFPHGTVAMIDKMAGVLLTALGRDMEDPLRRVAYGRAGEFRVPAPVPAKRLSWGEYYKDAMFTRLEYRTPGSFLLHHPGLFNFAADTIRAAFRMGLYMDGRELSEIPDVQGIINNCDADAAVKLVKDHKKYYQAMFNVIGTGYSEHSRTMDILQSGAKASGLFGTDVADNWNLNGTWNGDNYGNGNKRWHELSQRP